jgi:hypothetical protein
MTLLDASERTNTGSIAHGESHDAYLNLPESDCPPRESSSSTVPIYSTPGRIECHMRVLSSLYDAAVAPHICMVRLRQPRGQYAMSTEKGG